MVLLYVFPTLQCDVLIPFVNRVYWSLMILSCLLVVLDANTIGKWHAYGKLRSSMKQDRADRATTIAGSLREIQGSGKTIRQEGQDALDSDGLRNSERKGEIVPAYARLLTAVSALTVPKTWFIWFYVAGLIWSGLLLITNGRILHVLIDVFVVCLHAEELFTEFDRIPLGLFLCHCSKRLLEEFLYVRQQTSVSSQPAQMHVFGFLIGLSFYLFVPLAWASGKAAKENDMNPTLFFGLTLFLYSSYHQLVCHQILRKLRRGTLSSPTHYGVPYGDWFRYSSSPHYLAEILIYVSLIIISFSREEFVPTEILLAFIFTALNLTITAAKTHEWYEKTFGAEYTKLNRVRIIPWVF